MNVEFGTSLIGALKSSQTPLCFQAVNPKTNEFISTKFYQASKLEVDFAIDKAQLAFELHFPLQTEKRVQLMRLIAQKINQNREELIHWFCLETGLSENRAETELNRSIFQFENYADGIENGYALEQKFDDADPKRFPNPKPALRKTLLPIGPVVVFGASNFPFAYSTLGGDVASAFAAGCPVIVKAHSMHPHTSTISAFILAEAVAEIGIHEGYFSHLLAVDYEVGEQLVSHPNIKAVGFTGSIAGGMALQELINQRTTPIPLYAEMGSSNPIVVTNLACKNKRTKILKQIADAVIQDAGQFCTSPGILILEQNECVSSLLDELKQLFDQAESFCMLHPTILDRYLQRKKEQAKMVQVYYDGAISGNFIKATLGVTDGKNFIENSTIQEEIFGSYLTLVRCQNKDEVIQCLKSLKGQLTTSIYHEENEVVTDFLQIMAQKCGRLILNGVPTGVEVSVAQQHGGPFPSSSQPYFSAVGWDAIKRFSVPLTIQRQSDKLQFILKK